jgi:hypothetical protein
MQNFSEAGLYYGLNMYWVMSQAKGGNRRK